MEKLKQAISDILDMMLGYDRQPDGTYCYEIYADYRDEMDNKTAIKILRSCTNRGKDVYNESMIQKNERGKYASDLSDSQWAIIEPLFPRAGNRSKWEKRELVDAVLYFADNGCKW